MSALIWVGGLARRRPADLAGGIFAVALAVGFLAALGGFVSVDRAHLTARATRSVTVDWQVQATPGADLNGVTAAVNRLPYRRAIASVDVAAVRALSSTTSGAARTTGRAYVVGLAPGYVAAFPGELRLLVGTFDGPVLLQQTASNLAAAPGDTVRVQPPDGPDHSVRVSGVVDMPQEDSFFQTVGAPAGAGPSAPPDNVLLVPAAQFARLTAGAAVAHQVHVTFSRGWLPGDPAAAAAADDRARNHFEAAAAGAALIGDNLGAALSAAREDALYGELLFLLLGLPAFVVALAVVGLVVQVRGERRVRELGLIRMRGGRGRELAGAAAAETTALLVPGVAVGWPIAAVAAEWAFGRATLSLPWFVVGALCVCGLVAGLQAVSIRTVVRPGANPMPGVRAVEVPPSGRPWPLRAGLDGALLVGAGLVFWLVARTGYHVVLVPEGVPSTSVDWAALLAPALAWPGLALLVWRLVDAVLARLRPRRSTHAAELVAAALRRRRRGVARGATVLAVALGVAGSTAVFTATYRTQSRLDVALTVGADVAVQLPSDPAAAARLASLAKHAPQVSAVSTQEHRFAYVGSDLQDLYGVDPSTIARVAPLQDAFVPGGSIAADLRALRQHPDGVLLSAETLHDYQLHPGDTIRLRLQSGATRQYRPVTFRVVGAVAEWPTAPKDSFIVANAAFVAHATGTSATATVLIASPDPAATAGWLRGRAGPTARIADTAAARGSVTTASGLAATDLGGLARLELGFGVLLAVTAFALALLVSVLQRRRALVILAALGATPRQRGRFLAAEARAVLIGGVLGGVAITTAVAAMLVKVMTGIFDPPPDHPSVPWGYLALLVCLVTATAVAVVSVVGRWAGRAGPRELRDL